MKKLLVFGLLATLLLTLAGCNSGKDDKEKIDDYTNLTPAAEGCKGEGDYIVVNGVCLLISDVLSGNIRIDGEETIVQYANSVELMTDFVADLTDSKGLAVVPRDVFDTTLNTGGGTSYDLINLAATANPDEDTENLIVKLTEEGFFEEVSFSDSTGLDVQIMANPLVLEVYGAYTIVVFEVDLGYDNQSVDFSQKVYDSLWAGGIYIIHNESGKLFATKEVTFTESTYTYTEDHSRHINLTVTLNEPVIETQYIPQYDEFGSPIYDAEGNHVHDEILVPLLDSDGNPIVFTEGPILTEFQELPLVEYFIEQEVDAEGNLMFDAEGNPIFVQEVDAEGNPIFDENGEPVFAFIEQPILDEDGNPIIEIMEIPLYDEEGNVRYQEQFEIEMFIEDIVEITYTEHYANVVDNPLSNIAQKFVDKIVSEYYNWNYYRVNNYMITSNGFSATDDDIFYMEMKVNATDAAKQDNFVMKLSYDSETDEIILEEYINASLAGFDQCEIIIDPRNNNIICNSWDANIKVYSESHGLKIIADTKNLQPVTFPNGELYFYDNMQSFVEELGYWTTLLYTINSDGSIQSSFIELGEREQLCNGPDCYNYINVDMYDMAGNQYAVDWYNTINIELSNGDSWISNADLELLSLGEFDSGRAECTDEAYGCWYNVKYHLYDGEDYVGSYDGNVQVYPEDPIPAFEETYQIEDAYIEYLMQPSEENEVCDDAEGCLDDFMVIDESIGIEEWYVYATSDIDYEQVYAERITMNNTNDAVYNYTKDVSGMICEYETCEEWVEVRMLDENGEKLNYYYNSTIIEVDEGDIIPLYISYSITDNTTLTEEDSLCTTSTGCWRDYSTFDSINYTVKYEAGDTIYETITFTQSDKINVLEETLTSEICINSWGCGSYIDYIIEDDLGNLVYEFEIWVNYDQDESVPYSVTATLADVTIESQKVYGSERSTCDDDTCRNWFSLEKVDSPYNQYLASGTMVFQFGEDIIQRIIIAEDAVPTEIVDYQKCEWDEGCTIYTNSFIVLDEEGIEVILENNEWSILPVFFEKGDEMPIDDNFEATFTIKNIEYQMSRLNIYDFIYKLNSVVILEDNLYLIERESWAEGEDNVILTYNEDSNRYLAMYTNLSAVKEITKLGDGYVAINDSEDAIYKFQYNVELSGDNYYYFDVSNLTSELSINGVNDLIVDYDGSIYFKGIDNFIQLITGTINGDGTVTIDTEYVEREIIRVRPVN